MAEKKSDSMKIRDKESRRERIRQLITTEHIATQMELSRRLEEEGFQVTQATVSRDIRELRLAKRSDGKGGYHYEMSDTADRYHASGKFYSLFASSVTKVDYAQNLVVIRTNTGMAQAVCATMDEMEWPDVLGTVAGDDTVLVIARSEVAAGELVATLKRI